jgi:hypothetical protein
MSGVEREAPILRRSYRPFQSTFLTCRGVTAKRARPLARRAAITFLPPRVAILARKPWTRCRRRIFG